MIGCPERLAAWSWFLFWNAMSEIMSLTDDEAARIAEEAGLRIVVNRRIKVEHHRLVRR